jgi:hypothetical protein
MSLLTTATVSAEDTWTNTVTIEGYFNFSVDGTFDATVTVQRSYDNGVTWHDVDTFTEPSQEVGFDPEYSRYRAGCKTGDYVSGNITLRFGSEDHELH